MIIVKCADSGKRYPDTTVNEGFTTPKQVLESHGIRYSGAHVSMNGTILRAEDLNKTFQQLGAVAGTINLSAIVKADGACK